MAEKVLFVDDDQKILNGISRQFEDVFNFEIAAGPKIALEICEQDGPFSVVVSDMRMPGMNGIELLSQIRKDSPETVRIMLTGYADLKATIDAVNEGNIFRFLSKPCPQETLERAVRDGLEQHRLITSERELLEGTLHGSIKVMSEILSLVNPLAFGRTSQLRRIALGIGRQLDIPDLWDLKIATMLFPLGCVTVSQKALECAFAGLPIPDNDLDAYRKHPSLGKAMLEQIPRLEGVATIVEHQNQHYDGTDNHDGLASGDEIPIGARILKLASDFEIEYKKCGETALAMKSIKDRIGHYDPAVIEALQVALRNGLCQTEKKEVPILELDEGMVLAQDVVGKNGQLMVTAGQEITESIRARLKDFCKRELVEDRFVIELLGEVEPANLATV